MTKLNEWLKNLLVSEYGCTDIKEDYGKLKYGEILFGLGEIVNPYLLYKYAIWYNDGSNHSIPLLDGYDCALTRDFISKVLHLSPQVVIGVDYGIEESQTVIEEKEFTGGLFDFL